jgi:hypothetical protein
VKIKNFTITVSVFLVTILVFNSSNAQADIQVYDNNNQYLGIMTWMNEAFIDLFIPSLGGTFKYAAGSSGYSCGYMNVVFESSNCSGIPYSNHPFPVIWDLSIYSMEGFYKVDYSGKKIFRPGSNYAWNCECEQNVTYSFAEYYPYVQVQMPFTTPIALPLRFEVKSKTVVIPLN